MPSDAVALSCCTQLAVIQLVACRCHKCEAKHCKFTIIRTMSSQPPMNLLPTNTCSWKQQLSVEPGF